MRITTAAGDKVGEGRGVHGAAMDVGGQRLGVQGRGGGKAGDDQKKEEGDEGDGEKGEEPFLGNHAPAAWDDQCWS